jgi:hypothetical protein
MSDGATAGSTSPDNLNAIGGFHRFTGLTAGNNTFTMKYRVSANTGIFGYRAIQVMGF